MMLGISTSLWTKDRRDLSDLKGWLEDLGLSAVELDFRVTAEQLERVRPSLDSEIEVISLHNFCPVPDGVKPEKASADLFNLASLDWEERRLAIRYTIRTIELAHELEAEVVILHLGFVALEGTNAAFYREDLFKGEKKGEFLRQRANKVQKHLDALFLALEPIAKRAESLGIILGVENRNYPHEIPLADEIGLVLEAFEGAPFGYWHDVGHAHVLECLGFVNQRELLERYKDHLIGVHLHDAKGLKDHLPLGKGEVDLQALRPFFSEVRKVLEVHPPVEEKEIKEGLSYLQDIGLL